MNQERLNTGMSYLKGSNPLSKKTYKKSQLTEVIT